jgi:hypothetical protein
VENKREQARAMLTNARRNLAHNENLIRRARGRATPAELAMYTAKVRRYAAEIERLETAIAHSVAMALSDRNAPIAARDIINWTSFKDNHWIVPMAADSPDPDDVADLRIMDLGVHNEPATGVVLLWSDELQSLVAAAFERLLWKRSEAEDWLRDWLDKSQESIDRQRGG